MEDKVVFVSGAKEQGRGGRRGVRGFTLTEVLAAVSVAGVLAAIAYPLYSDHVRRARLAEAQAALLENARFMEGHYRRYGRFKQSSTAWPELPVKGTDAYCIRLHGVARGAEDGKFTLKAVARGDVQPKVVKVNDALTVWTCGESDNGCGDKGDYFTGRNADKGCRVLRH